MPTTTSKASQAQAVKDALSKFRAGIRELAALGMPETEARQWLERIINQEMRQ
jgi:hypothetical protein